MHSLLTSNYPKDQMCPSVLVDVVHQARTAAMPAPLRGTVCRSADILQRVTHESILASVHSEISDGDDAD